LNELKLKYEAATQSVAAQGGHVTKSQQAKRLIDAAIAANVDQLRQCCSGIKKICQKFNIVAEMNVMLNQMIAEKRRIHNIKAANEAEAVIQSITRLIQEFSRTDGGSGPGKIRG